MAPSQPSFTTERLKLVPMTEEHVSVELELDTDPNVTRYLFQKPRTVSMVRDKFPERLQVAVDAPGHGYWIGLFNGEPIGWFLLEVPARKDQGSPTGQAEIGYRLLPRFWRQGLATEGSRALMRHAFTNLDCERVFAETMAINTGSRATMSKLGMIYIRTFETHFEDAIDGSEKDDVEYAITREEWQRLTEA